MKTKKIRKGAIAVLGAVLACCVSAAGAGFAGGLPALAMNTASNTEIISGDLWDSTALGISQTPLQTLVSKIAGGKTSYTDLLNAVKTSSDGAISASEIRTANSNKDLVITLGGKKWTVTYVSEDMSGNVIATLWYTDEDITSSFSGSWRSDSGQGSYAGYSKLGNHYGGSYMRAVVLGNGGQYYTATGAVVQSDAAVSTVNTTVAQTETSAFYDFAMGDISKYLVTPNLVEWQQVQSVDYIDGYRPLNDNLIDVSSDWYGGTSGNIYQSTLGDSYYYQWGTDKVWLPSVAEVGTIWDISSNQRAVTNTAGAWLRSGYSDSAYGAYCLVSGAINGGGNTTNSKVIRPAIHLNLTKAYANLEKSQYDLFDTTTGTFNANVLNNLYYSLGATDYNSLASKVVGGATYNSAQLANLNNHQGDISVTFGGFNWTVTYLSTTTNGDVIATLWYDDEEEDVSYSGGWRTQSLACFNLPADYTLYSNHYGGSYIRAVTLGNGGTYWNGSSIYVTSNSSVSSLTTSAEQLEASKFYQLAQGNLSQYLAAPSQVSWQQELTLPDYWRYSNENLVDVSSDAANKGVGVANGQWLDISQYNAMRGDDKYYNWANDKVWLPSFCEAVAEGLWQTTQTQRVSNSAQEKSWLRSGDSYSGCDVHVLDGWGNVGGAGTHNTYGVRPAIHLNLTEAAKNVGGGYFTQRNAQLADAWNAAVEESLFNAGKQVTFTLTDNWYALSDETYGTSFGTGAGFNNGRIFAPAGTNIIFDLNGYRIDRNLIDLTENGQTVLVFGNLTIEDGSGADRGLITGACNYTDAGGAVLVSGPNGGRLTFNSGTISGNRTRYGGAGIMSHAPLIINGGIIEKNCAPTSATGGVITSVYFEMNGGIIRNNYSNSSGAGLYLAFDGIFYINGGEIYGNEVTGSTAYGGGIYVRAGKLTINDVKIHDNTASRGGGMWISSYGEYSPEVIINRGEITGNTATVYGGGIYMSSGKLLTINDVIMSGNTSADMTSGQGGAIALYGGEAVINGGTFSNNTATRGAGLFLNGTAAVLTMNSGIIGNNTATHYGGGLYVNAGSHFIMNGGQIINNEVTGNTPNTGDWGYGGGLFVNSADATFDLKGGVITGNKASKAGGGVALYQAGSIFNLTYGTVNGNTLTDGTTKSNVYLHATSHYINIKGNLGLGQGTWIGVSLNANKTDAFTLGYLTYNTSNAGNYFFADNSHILVNGTVNGKTEIAIGTAAATYTTSQWSYKVNGGSSINISTSAVYFSVEYSGNSYSVSNSKGIGRAVDENGRPVTAMVNAGRYYFEIAGTSANDKMYTLNPMLTFEILPASINEATVSVTDGLVYNGKAHTPEVTVVLGGVTLTKDKDYTVEYFENINAGTARVTVYGAGNYGGTAYGSFIIEKRNLEIRWGDLEAEYDGTSKSAVAYAEGVLDGESVAVTLTYEFNGKKVTPISAGTYSVHAILGNSPNYQLAAGAQISETFVINPKTVEAVWGTLSFVYNGSEQQPKATYTDINGVTTALTVTVNGTHADAATYTATAAVGNSNYAVSVATKNVRYTIAKKGVEPVVGSDSHTYDGTAFVPEITVLDLDGNKLTLDREYFADGASIGTSAPVNVGKYFVRVTLTNTNYALADSDGNEIAYYDFEYAVTSTDANGSWTFADNVYSGSGKAPEYAYTDSAETLGFTVTYGVDKGNGTADEYTEDKPVNAGNYVAKVEFDNGNYNEILHTFTIAKKTVTVSWAGDNLSVIGSGNSYKWLYDGSEHAPVATAIADGEELSLTVAGQTNVGSSYTATAVLEDNEVNANYTLSGNTCAYSIAQSTITAVKWYEYGSKNPVAANANLSYQYISVYGWDGPRLSAYGVATMQGQGTDGGTVTRTVEVPMAVTYGGAVNTSGYWAIDNYTATAAIRNGDGNNCTTSLSADDRTVKFAVTEKQLETTLATIKWAFDTDAKYDSENDVWYWIYDGNTHAPEARCVLPGATYDADDPSTYKVLPVGGSRTDAGTYYAYILPSCGYDFDSADADKVFEIRPREITVAWTGVNGAGNNFDWIYDGEPHAPSVRVVSGAGGIQVALEAITEYTDAGNYVAYAKVNANFVIAESETSSATQKFSIKQLVLDPDDIVWTGKGGSETDFTWIYDGVNSFVPAATLEVTLGGNKVNIALKVMGEASTVGDHTAYAMLDSTKAVNANFVLKDASCAFNIINGALAKIEWEGAENGEELEFTYDGTTLFTPKAYYWLDGDKVYLNVVGGAVDAGEYTAYVTDYTGITEGMSHKFTVKPAELTVSWTQTSAEYDGAAHSPEASFKDADGNTVTLTSGKDYAVTSFTTAGTYTAGITFLNKNYTYSGETGSVKFIVTPKKVFISWTANDDGTFNFEYNGTAQAPAFTCAEKGVTVTVTGAETAVGTYVAVATVDDVNYCLYDSLHSDGAEREFSIIPFAITVKWKGENGSETDFDWEYSGDYIWPTATYTDWDGVEQSLTVRGERMDAGKDYTATAVLPVNCSFKFTTGENAGTHAFTISPKRITDIVWYGENGSETDFEWIYTGEVIAPVAKTADGDTLAVSGGATDAGEYTATAVLPNTQNYMFDESVGGTHKFKITEKTVDVIWYGKDDSITDFNWDYTGEIIRPAAKFADVNNEYVDVPVNGGASAAGSHTATAADVFTNYVFSEATQTQVFYINQKTLAITWSDQSKLVDGIYTYEYNGKAQMPVATADADINLSYTVKNANEDVVGSVIGAGKYTVTIAPANKNYTIDSAQATVEVEITKKTVSVIWQSNLNLLYTGSEVVPEAWFIDAENQAVALKVTGAQVEAGTGYKATAEFMTPNDNYVLDEDTVTEEFDIVKNTDGLVWDWEKGEWSNSASSTEPDGGEDGEDGDASTDPSAPDTAE